jgi:hypothetical protein
MLMQSIGVFDARGHVGKATWIEDPALLIGPDLHGPPGAEKGVVLVLVPMLRYRASLGADDTTDRERAVGLFFARKYTDGLAKCDGR